MNTIKYQAFLKAVDCGSLTKTAAAMNYTQPAVSHMIHSLEKSYGFPLFQRTTERVLPTQEALRIVPYIRNILYNEQCLYEETNRIKKVEVGHIRVGTYFSVMSSFLPKLIQVYRERHPAIGLSLVEGNTMELNKFLKNRTVDFAFATRRGFEEFEFIPLLQDELLAVLPEGHPLCEKEIITPQELFQYPIISTEEDSECDLEEISRLAGAEPKISLRSKIETSILALVACNMGVAVIPSLYLLKPYPGLEIRKLETPCDYREIGIVAISMKELSPASREFVEMIPGNLQDCLDQIVC